MSVDLSSVKEVLHLNNNEITQCNELLESKKWILLDVKIVERQCQKTDSPVGHIDEDLKVIFILGRTF